MVLERVEMKRKLFSKSKAFSGLEDEVYEALRMLPSDFSVMHGDNCLQHIKDGSGDEFMYKPDFEVFDRQGRRFLVELKSERAMSLQNMVRFAEIDKAVRREAGVGFLILVWGSDEWDLKYGVMTEFRNLNIYHVRHRSEIIQVVEHVFEDYFQR